MGNIYIHISGNILPVAVKVLEPISPEKKDDLFIQMDVSQEMDVFWGDPFVLSEGKAGKTIGEGKILNPERRTKTKKIQHNIDFLKELLLDEEGMILALARKEGIHGITESEILDFSSIEKELLTSVCLKLEEKGKVRILSFSPIVLLYKPSFESLIEKLISFLQEHHQTHPDEIGVSPTEIRKRFSLHPRLLSLMLRYLNDQHRIRMTEKYVFLSDHTVDFSPKEEKILEKLEEIFSGGEIRSLTLKDLQKKFAVSPEKMDMMIAHLTEKIKVVEAKEGFIVHSDWLEDLIQDLKASKGKTLTIAEFKERTGLSRKYAIPLLELLDQMGVTRRSGISREIL